jgi:hypothetical protein
MLIRQDTPHSAFVRHWGCSGDPVIQVRFGARHVARLSNWQMCCQTDNSGQPGFNADVCCRNSVISILFNFLGGSAKRDRFKYSKRSLFIAYIMASGDTCPQETSNARHVATLAGLKTDR